MSEKITLTIDGVQVPCEGGQTILDAATAAGIYIPHLCAKEELSPFGSCRVCTVLCDGRPQAACTQPVSDGMVVENDTEPVREIRRDIIDMLFVEGNHYCMFCQKSGDCELQALAYRLGITAPKYPFMYPQRELDASHPEIWIDHNRCILCARCIRASRDLDGKGVFQFVGRGADKRVAVNARARLADTNVDVTDKAIEVCPVGALMRKGHAYTVPVGERKYDHNPIGSDIEKARTQE
ncbi:(2Fe-2S)-binding protein [bacterium]|nr:(2Fe-2S)-binding protein [bacterium]